MVEDNQQANPNEEKSSPPQPSTPNANEHPSAVESKPHTTSNASNIEKVNKEPINVIVNVPKENVVVNIPQQDNTPAKTANRISRFAIAVNIVLIGLTFLLFRKTTQSTDAAIRSANAAESTYREQKFNDSSLRARDSIKYIIDTAAQANKARNDSAIEVKRFDLQNKSIQAQIKSLQETNREFQVENEPFLQLTVEGVQNFAIGGLLDVTVKIDNLGKYPAMIILDKSFSAFRVVPPPFEEVYKLGKKDEDLTNTYVSSSIPASKVFHHEDPITESQFTKTQQGTYKFYMVGFMKYENLVTHSVKTYRFEIQIQITKTQYMVKELINKNIP